MTPRQTLPLAPSIAAMPLKPRSSTPAPLPTGRRERESGSLTSLRWRTLAVTICLLVYMPVLLAAAWAGAGLLPGEDGIVLWSHRKVLTLQAYGVVAVMVIVFFCLWLWRAAKSVRRLGVTVSVEQPGMAVLYFFIPVAWWYKPYAIVRTIWQVAMDPADWDNVAISQALPLWWIMWILQWAAALVIIGVELLVMSADKRFLQTVGIWIFAGCGLVATLSLLAVIRQTSAGLRRQLRSRAQSGAHTH